MIQVKTRMQLPSVSSEEVRALQKNAVRLGLTGVRVGDRRFRHGRAHTPLWRVWKGVLERCYDPMNNSYPLYGGRGITVDKAWHTFVGFYQDMGDRPPGCTLERVDNNGPYNKVNCRWATVQEQQNNRRDNVRLTYAGMTLTLAQWARKTGLTWDTLWQRLNQLKWPVERALTQPQRVLKPRIRKGA